MTTLRITVFAIVVALVSTSLAWASRIEPSWAGSVEGIPTWVTVFTQDGAEPLDTNRPWWERGNTSSDTYVFSFHDPSNARLALQFSTLPSGILRARFFEASVEPIRFAVAPEDGHVVLGNVVLVFEMKTRGEVWIESGHINYDLESTRFIDGRPAIEYSSVGDGNGVPDYEYLTFLGREDEHVAGRFSLAQRIPDGPPFTVRPAAMPTFPYFGMGRSYPGNSIWFEANPPPVYFDIERDRLIKHSLVGFQQGGTYRISSSSVPPNVNFEAPMVFYNFDPSNRYAHLVARADSFPPEVDEEGNVVVPAQTSFRYSWKEDPRGQWRYSFGVAGTHAYEAEQTFGQVTVRAPGYAETPSFVLDQAWPVVTFIESVDGYPGSEGIYFYTAQGDYPRPWIDGRADAPPSHLASPRLPETDALTIESIEGVPPGYRAEYRAIERRLPSIYLSLIDGRVHLRDAQDGFWNLGDGEVLRSKDLDGDGIVDAWHREFVARPGDGSPHRYRPGVSLEVLHYFGDVMVYSGPEGARIVDAKAFAPSHVALEPPRDARSWNTFRDEMERSNAAPRDPRDLASWLAPASGATLSIPGASVEAARITESGFRFVLDRPGSAPSPTGGLDGLRGNELATMGGSVIVTYDGTSGTWAWTAATGPTLRSRLLEPHLVENRPARLELVLTNLGTLDATGPATLYVDGEEAKAWDQLLVPAEGSTKLAWNLALRDPGLAPITLEQDGRLWHLGELVVTSKSRLDFADGFALSLGLEAEETTTSRNSAVVATIVLALVSVCVAIVRVMGLR